MPPPDPGGAVRGKRARRPGRSRAAGGHSEQRSAPGCGFASSSSNEPIAHGGPSASAVRGGDPRVPGQSQPGFGARGGGEHCRFHRGDQGAAEGTDVAGRHQLVVPRHDGDGGVRSARVRARVPLLCLWQRGDQDQAGAETGRGHRRGQGRSQRRRQRLGQRHRGDRVRVPRPRRRRPRRKPVEARLRRQLLQQVERYHRERGGQGVRKDHVHVDAPFPQRAPGDGGRGVAGGDGRGDRREPGVRGRGGGSGPGGSDRSVDRDVSRVRRDHGGVVARRDDAGRGRVRVADERRRQRGSDHARGGGGGGAGRGGGVRVTETRASLTRAFFSNKWEKSSLDCR